MKKAISILIGVLAMTNITTQVFAADIGKEKDKDTINQIALIDNSSNSTTDNKESDSILIINGKSIKVKKSELKIINSNLMVPLKTTAESLGFKVDINKDEAVIDNDQIKSYITVGFDCYSYFSSHAIGATAPESFGVAPVMENGTILVPIKLYNILFNNEDAVGTFKCDLNDNKSTYVINGSINTGWIKVDDNWYYINTDGTIKKGWIQDQGNWYFLYDNGIMATNTITPDGYKVGTSGTWDFGEKLM